MPKPMPPPNKYGGRCRSCHNWVNEGVGFLGGKDHRGKWTVICATCIKVEVEQEQAEKERRKAEWEAFQAERIRKTREDAENARKAREERDRDYRTYGFTADDDPDDDFDFDPDARSAADAFRDFARSCSSSSTASRSHVPPYFAVLGLAPPVSRDEVKARYRTLSMEHHPDKGGDARKFIEINDAYEKALTYVGGR